MANWRSNGGGSSGGSVLSPIAQTINNLGNIGTRIQFGRMGTFNNSTANTFQLTLGLSQKFDAIRVVFANTNPLVSDLIVPCKVSVIANTTDLNNSSGTWTSVTKNGQTAFMTEMPTLGGSGARPDYTVSDWININAVDRDDGGSTYLLVVRAQFAANASLPVFGNGTNDVKTNWASKSDGRIWAMRNAAGDFVSDPTLWPASGAGITNTSQSPIAGVQFLAKGKVLNFAGGGDSIVDGFGSTYQGESYVMRLSENLHNAGTLATAYANFAWSGKQSNGKGGFHNSLLDMLDSEVLPAVLIFESGSLNDPSPLLTAAIVNQWKSNTLLVVDKCIRRGVVPMPVTVMPSTYASHALGATDSLRLAHNADILSFYNARGITCLDVATPIAGATEGHGQQEPDATFLPDGSHPNDLGCTTIVNYIEPTVRSALGL